MLVSGKNAQRISQTILVKKDQLAVLADDDARADDLARNPFFHEVDENGADIESPVVPEPSPADASKGDVETDASGGDDVSVNDASDSGSDNEPDVATTRRRKPADSGGV
jgi:hypothetical protein